MLLILRNSSEFKLVKGMPLDYVCLDCTRSRWWGFLKYVLKENTTAKLHFLAATFSILWLGGNIRKLISAIRHPRSEIRHSPSDIRHPRFHIRHLTSEIRHPTSKIRHLRSDIWHSTPDIWDPTSDIQDSTSDIRDPSSTYMVSGVIVSPWSRWRG